MNGCACRFFNFRAPAGAIVLHPAGPRQPTTRPIRRVKRFLLVLLTLLAVATGAMLAFGDELAAAAARAGIGRLQAITAARGVVLSQVSFAQAAWLGFGGIVCEGVRGTARLREGLLEPGPEALTGEVSQVAVEVEDWWSGTLVLTLSGGSAEVLDAASIPTGERISQVRVEVEIETGWRHLDAAMARLEDEVRRLFSEGRCRVPARILGVVHFKVGSRWHDLPVVSRWEGGETVLAVAPDDVRGISRDYPRPLTETEIALVARNPVRAPALLRLSERASMAAAEQWYLDHEFPQDAFRHVYWSYLLTREFGPEFAEQVTSAHEIGPTYETGAANIRMDLANNAVGRDYALAGVPEGEIAERVRRDPQVVKSVR